ncbi:hypothetical protein M422DRAFT_257663 [Sphaerobolus stellatus SS14]|uniref:Uncharacterized protein n=1 Tax=Sphaerobolus stellatus (strain SS14) TaxID=990650 RepID=A0A0C9VDV8_SPHS4|nr:hypothetical protein M422DRAFT_257663 [Sphaerobolus stellatus SS14]
MGSRDSSSDTDSPALLPLQSKGRRLENLRGKQPIGIADQASSTSASSALFSLPATMGTERLVVDLGSPLCHSMSSLPPSSRRAESPFPPSHSKARHTPSSKPAAPRTTPAMPPPASRILVRPSGTRNGLIGGGTAIMITLDIPTIKSVVFPVSKPTSIASRTHVFAPLKNKYLFQSLSISSSNYHCLDWWHNRDVTVHLPAAPSSESTVSTPPPPKLPQSPPPPACIAPPPNTGPIAASSINGQHYGAPNGPTMTNKKLWFGGSTRYRGVRDDEDEDKLHVCPAFKEIGAKFGAFDLVLIPIGAYALRGLLTYALLPKRQCRRVQRCESKRTLAMHWGTSVLSSEGVLKPVEELKAKCAKVFVKDGKFMASISFKSQGQNFEKYSFRTRDHLTSPLSFSIFDRKDENADAEKKEGKPYEVSLVLAVVVKKLVGNTTVKVRIRVLFNMLTANATCRSRNPCKPPMVYLRHPLPTVISIEPVASDLQIRRGMVSLHHPIQTQGGHASALDHSSTHTDAHYAVGVAVSIVLPYMDGILCFDTPLHSPQRHLHRRLRLPHHHDNYRQHHRHQGRSERQGG